MRVGISTRTTTGVHKLNQHYRNHRDKKFQVAELAGQGLVAGYNGTGAFGLGVSGGYRSSPVIWGGKGQPMMDITLANHQQHMMQAVDNDGDLWMTGYSYYGQFGANQGNTYYSSPVQVPGTWTKNRGGFQYYTTTFWKDDEVYLAGYNGVGQLGNGDTVPRSSPVKLEGKWFARITNVYYDNHAFENGGRVWVWGSNYYGVLGLNNTTTYSSPIIQYGSHQWACYRPGNYFIHAIDGGTGKLWAWGRNDTAQLGQANVQPYSYPVVLPGSWSYFPPKTPAGVGWHAGIRDGNCYVWGSNSHGQLGIGHRTIASSMILLPGTWAKTQPGSYFTQYLTAKGDYYISGYVWVSGIGQYRSSPTRLPGNYKYDPTMPFNCVGGPSRGGYVYSQETGKEYMYGSNYYSGVTFDPVKGNNYQSSPTLVRGDWATHGMTAEGIGGGYNAFGIGSTC
jgi:alpha-tubulin suppressor-like RCC1 family protein